MGRVRRRRRGLSPPILTLLGLFEEHRAAFEYDWRNRLNVPLADVGAGMSYGEAWRLTHVLMADPGTQLATSMGGWDHPASREWLLFANLYDLTYQATGAKKPKPYPRPWPDQTTKRTGPGADVTQEMVIAALRAAGHTVGLPPLPGRRRDARGRFLAA